MSTERIPPSLARANARLAEIFERMTDESGGQYGAEDLKLVVGLGVEKIVERAKGRPSNDGIRHVLSEVTTGRSDMLVEIIAADVQDIAKQRTDEYLFSVKCKHGTLLFLPDVFIPQTVDSFKSWKTFLDGLDPAFRHEEDPVTRLRGRILYRAGQWLGGLRFAGHAPVRIHEDIREIVGDLDMRGREVDTNHTVSVGGSLYADLEQLRDEPSFVDLLSGQLRIYDDDLRTPADLDLAPDELTDWGAGHGTLIHLNDRLALRLIKEEGPDGTIFALAEVVAGRDMDLRSERYVWDKSGWRRFERQVPPDTAYDVLRRFRRMCALLGIGDDFVTERKDAAHSLEENAGRIATLLTLARGAHSEAARNAVPQLARDRIQSLENDLLRLRALVVGEGAEFYRDMQEVEQDIHAVLEGLSDTRLKRVHSDISGHCTRISRAEVRADREYLKHLLESDGLTFGDVLSSGGRTLVFLNNLCRSKQARRLAAEAVGRVRDALREVVGGSGNQKLLLQLLRFPDPSQLSQLRTEYPDEGPAVVALGDVLNDIDQRKPLEIVRDFRMHRYKKDEDALSDDKKLLAHVLGMHKGTLDEVFARAERGHGTDDGRILQNALAVSLQSFVAEELRQRPIDLDAEKPSAVVQGLLDKLERYRPVIPEFNRLCVQGDDAKPAPRSAEAATAAESG